MSRGRFGTIIVMILSLLCAAALRVESVDWQAAESGRSGVSAGGGVAGMNSFALALVLGGLRGPLVMYLWSTSESQKIDRDLEDFDTKVEWIRLLQPEFDTVHLFQIWNKAYNISVLMASPADKYTTIMQALQYADNILKEKPGDINILQTIGNIYSNKLGGHPTRPEEYFYNRQLREESMIDANRKIAYPDDTRFRRLWQSTLVLDDQNRILPEFLTPRNPRPNDVRGAWNDGSTLQYLARFQPFPFGVSPAALAYNYAKRAQVALAAEGQKPLQMSPMVIDSRPGLELDSWATEEITNGRSNEGRAFGIEVPRDSTAASDAALAAISPTAPARDPRLLQAAIHDYDLASTLAPEMASEFKRHLSNPLYAMRIQLYASHLDDAVEYQAISSADRDYLLLRSATGSQASQLRAAAISEYEKALVECERIILTYYMEDEIVRATFPMHERRESVAHFTDQMVNQIFNSALSLLPSDRGAQFGDDRGPYLRDINRAIARLRQLQAKH
jgi:hypothetical protein